MANSEKPKRGVADSTRPPHDPEATALATELSTALKELHRALIRSEIGNDPTLENPYTALFALIGDPGLAWMGPLSELIARIDQQVADKEIVGMTMLGEPRGEAARLIGETKDENLAVFRMRHVMALQKEPDVGLATGRLRKALAKIPAG